MLQIFVLDPYNCQLAIEVEMIMIFVQIQVIIFNKVMLALICVFVC